MPIGAPGATPQSLATAAHAAHSKSWTLPQAKSENLLYITDPVVGGVFVYSYKPPRYKFVGMLADAKTPLGECVDQAQHLFVTDDSVTFEYDHGGTKPIRVLGDPGGTPNSCSIDPVTRNLAVTDSYSTPSVPISVAVYANGRGRPKLYPAPDFNYMAFCTYDDNGDLFVDGGKASSNAFLLEELPNGSSSFRAVKLKRALLYPGGLRWRGNDLVVGDSGRDIIYRFEIKGTRAREIGSTSLRGALNIEQFFITGPRVIEPSGSIQGRSGSVDIYDYPAGGNPRRNLPNFGGPYAAVISRALK